MSDTVSFSELVEFIRTTGAVWSSFDEVPLKILDTIAVVEEDVPALKFKRIGYVFNFTLKEEDIKVIYGSNKHYSIHHKKGFMIHVWYENLDTMYLP